MLLKYLIDIVGLPFSQPITNPGIPDRSEPVSMMEPTRISATSRQRATLADLSVDLATNSAGFRRSLPEGVINTFACLVWAMNCYYSNLIEGHDTHPRDIERAPKKENSASTFSR